MPFLMRTFDPLPIFWYHHKMWFVMKLVLRIAANAALFWVLQRFVSGFTVSPRAFPILDSIRGLAPFWQTLIVGGLVLTLLNMVLRPVLTIVSLPLTVITFGLWHIVINMAILGLANWLLPELAIGGFSALFIGSILLGIVNTVF